jgi:hypothetical protein
MKTVEEQMEFLEKLKKGFELTYKRLLEFKKQKNSVIVVMRGNKIVKIKP